jgi:iron complex outermembrane recepter protein
MTDFFFGPLLGMRNVGTAAKPNLIPMYQLDQAKWFRPLTQAEYSNIAVPVLYDNKSWLRQASFSISGGLFNVPAGEVKGALTLEGSWQGYSVVPPYGLRSGVQTLCCLVTTGGGGSRDRYATGLEFDIPVLDTVKLTLAGRLDKYIDASQVDLARTWSSGLEWRPMRSLLVRANYATTFKAPDMSFIYSQGTGAAPLILDTTGCLSAGGTRGSALCTGDPYNYITSGVAIGDPTLHAEKGKTWGAGFVWDATEGLSLSVDYYDIRMDDEIQALDLQYILDGEAGCVTGKSPDGKPFANAPGSTFCQNMMARVTRDPGTDLITFVRGGYLNSSFAHFTGLDSALRYRLRTDRFGTFSWRADLTNSLKSEQQLFSTQPVDSHFRDSPTNFNYRSRLEASMGWAGAGWTANVFHTRYGSLPNFAGTGRVGPYTLYNVNVSKQFTDNLTAGLLVNNVFNNFGPRDPTWTTYPYFYGGYSPVGREASLQAVYRFD